MVNRTLYFEAIQSHFDNRCRFRQCHDPQVFAVELDGREIAVIHDNDLKGEPNQFARTIGVKKAEAQPVPEASEEVKSEPPRKRGRPRKVSV